MSQNELSSLIFVVGPTATGKTALAVSLAEKLQTEIINCDSVQVYHGIEIGTAKPTVSEQARVKHHLLSYVPKGEEITAGIYERDFLNILDELKSRGLKDLVVVGGSGFYVQAIAKGMFASPDVPTSVREEIDRDEVQHGLANLYQELHERDPEAALKIHANDQYRIKRALEIIRGTHTTWSHLQRQFASGLSDREAKLGFQLKTVALDLDREVLRSRVRTRAELMLSSGWLEEVQELMQAGFATWSPMQSVGYKEVQDFLREGGVCEGAPRKQLLDKIETATMQLSKRQRTWFKRDANTLWLNGACPTDDLRDEVLRFSGLD